MCPLHRRRKYPPRAEIRTGDAWQLARGTFDDQIIITRFNRAFDELVEHPELPHQVGIAVRLNAPRPNGLPNARETAQLEALEDDLARVMEAGNVSLFVGVITTKGMREFVFYTSDPSKVEEQFQSLQHATTGHEMQLMIQADPQWEVYQQFARAE